MVVRHPAIVSLSTRKWAACAPRRPARPLVRRPPPVRGGRLPHHLLVVKYEHLVADPQRTLAEIATFLELDGDIPADGIDTRRSATYERQWADLSQGGPWRRERLRALCRPPRARRQPLRLQPPRPRPRRPVPGGLPASPDRPDAAASLP